MSTLTLRPESVPTTKRQRRESLAGPTVEPTELNAHSFTSSRSFGNLIEPTPKTNQNQYLVVSPYLETEHQLDLSTVNTTNRIFAQALTILEPTTPEYATTAYSETFNWPEVFIAVRNLASAESFEFPRTEFYVVEFRSQLRETIDNHRLFKLDKESHREATAAGGLLKYWFGSPDLQRRNLATCLWRGKDDAIEGGKGLWHKQARGIISTTYESINVSGLRLIVEEGACKWTFEPWSFH